MSEGPRFVGQDQLRQLFNEAQMYERLLAGELREVVYYDASPHVNSDFDEGARSQRAFYYDGDTVVADVHQFVGPDGDLLASGRPDPKWVSIDGIRYELLGYGL